MDTLTTLNNIFDKSPIILFAMMPLSGWILAALISVCAAQNVTCLDASNAVAQWAMIFLVAPAIFNCVSILLIVFISLRVSIFKDINEEIGSNTSWLARTATRVSFGPTAKRALLDYAAQRPEINKYIQITQIPPLGRRNVPMDSATSTDQH